MDKIFEQISLAKRWPMNIWKYEKVHNFVNIQEKTNKKNHNEKPPEWLKWKKQIISRVY